MDEELLIVGIDPGTTKAYAVFNIEKELLACKSKKELTLNDLISEISGYGKVLIAGTDRKRIPELVEKFATKTGAKIIAPSEDLEVKEKIELSKEYRAKNSHEKDAIASALNAYKGVRNIISRIESFAKFYNKEEIKMQIIKLVLGHGMSIKLAADIIERPDEEYVKESMNVLEKIERKKIVEGDFLRLLNRLREKEYEIKLLKKQNKRISAELNKIINRAEPIETKDSASKDTGKMEKLLSKRVKILYRALDEKSDSIKKIKARLSKLNNVISMIGKDFVLAKKLDNLGQNEYRRKEKILNIGYGDALLVNNPNIYSERVVSMLKDKVSIIICRNKPGKEINSKFVFINAKNIEMHEDMYFAAANKEQIKNDVSRIERLRKVIEEYKEERELRS